MQQFSLIYLFIDLFESVLHVSGDKLAHLQEHILTVYTALVQCTDIGALYQSCLYSQNVLLKMGEFVARNI